MGISRSAQGSEVCPCHSQKLYNTYLKLHSNDLECDMCCIVVISRMHYLGLRRDGCPVAVVRIPNKMIALHLLIHTTL